MAEQREEADGPCGAVRSRVPGVPASEAFHPEYAETEVYKPVTCHFGRHRFSTWWRVQQAENRELVKYMRGDSVEKGSMEEPIDSYLHIYYEDIEDLHRMNIYRLGI